MNAVGQQLLAAGAAQWVYPFLAGSISKDDVVDRIQASFGTVRPLRRADVASFVEHFQTAAIMGERVDNGLPVSMALSPRRTDLPQQYQYVVVVTLQTDENIQSTVPVVVNSQQQLAAAQIRASAEAAVYNEGGDPAGLAKQPTLKAGLGIDTIVIDSRITEFWVRESPTA